MGSEIVPPAGWNTHGWHPLEVFTIEEVDEMNGRDFELYVAKLLIGYYVATNVQVTPSSGDYGVDIVADFMGNRYAIQTKRQTYWVGPKAVRQVVGGMGVYGETTWRLVTETNSYRYSRCKTERMSYNAVIVSANNVAVS